MRTDGSMLTEETRLQTSNRQDTALLTQRRLSTHQQKRDDKLKFLAPIPLQVTTERIQKPLPNKNFSNRQKSPTLSKLNSKEAK